ncbi:MAG: sugar-binding transcriptional regulator [Lawsonibacter sp.]|jgi:deoxyribonucleoside regulator
MAMAEEKVRRLAHVARRYYLEDWKQQDIARELGVSRPMVSRLLAEARALGVVEITIHDPDTGQDILLDRLRRISPLRGGILVEDDENDHRTNQKLSQAAIQLLHRLNTRRLGVGWGHFVGQLVTWLEEHPDPNSPVAAVCPLVGNASFPIRNYHSNENVRLLAQQLDAQPHFLYLPALPESLEERDVLCSTELYHQVYQEWELMDTALVNIGNYPSTPDFASVARYGDRLQKEHCCGRLLAYYFNPSGQIISSPQDFAIQIPLDLLSRCPNVVGVCSANTSTRALLGALRTGRFTHLVARTGLIQNLLNEK